MILRVLLTVIAMLPATLHAETPRVVADIPPVHSLVARVMAGVGTPELLMQPGASPHGYSMRPSEAAALQDADLVIWIGPGLTPWLARAVETLGAEAGSLALLDAKGTIRLDLRESATFQHDHGDHAGHAGHAAHEEHAEHGEHEDHAGHEEGAHDATHGHEAHDHQGGVDTHAWLDPENARIWVDLIAAELSRIDPGNAATYARNAEAARAELASLIDEIAATLAPARDAGYLVYHDAYQYFEHRFDLRVIGAVAVSDAAAPGPARLAELRALVRDAAPRCAFFEPQFSPELVETVAQGTGLRQAALDPIGLDLAPGPDLYPQLLRTLARGIATCA